MMVYPVMVIGYTEHHWRHFMYGYTNNSLWFPFVKSVGDGT
ncbi:hypothetical protein HMPREF1306_03223 [Klebsiella pneumoniae subsp. pneumoniae WGLW2]|nr:hypothetical protein HMPREF1306_03223 [Klebsiella pneumoniae subsp. pneumoniae WGLW2]